MSGSPKYSRAELDRQRQAKIEAERKRRAEKEAKQRREAAERERQRQLKAERERYQKDLNALLSQMNNQADQVYDRQLKQLQKSAGAIQKAITTATQLGQLSPLAEQINQLRDEWEQAKRQKWREEEEAKRQREIERQQIALQDCDRRLGSRQADAQKFAPQGLGEINQSLAALRTLIQQGDPQKVAGPLETVQQALTTYLETVQQAKAQWQAAKTEAEQALNDIQSRLAGLQADPVVMCWQAHEIQALMEKQAAATTALAQEQFDQIAPCLTAVMDAETEIVATANAAQLKADQRDYVADSIASSLQELGFNIVYRQAEHQDHPASAIILGAVTHAGKGISVSVPVEGEVFYDVDGYSKQSVAVVGGGQAAVCDEAEQVIGEMHNVLAAEFGIQMGELDWEGKNPQRQLRQAERLPQSDSRSAQGS